MGGGRVRHFVRGPAELAVWLLRAKLAPCPHCRTVGALNRHGQSTGYAQDGSERVVRGHRLFCSKAQRDKRGTVSVQLQKLAPDDMQTFILGQLDRVTLAHNTFTPEALGLIVRASEGVLRRARNLCIASLLEAVRDRIRMVDLKQVNRVLMQPHWRKEQDLL